MKWIISDMDNILVILCSIFYAILCVFSIVTGLLYASGKRELNPVELSDKFMKKMNKPEKIKRFAKKMGYVTIVVGLVQGLAAFSLFKGYNPILYWIALGFTIFSILSVLLKLKSKRSLFAIVKFVFYIAILIVLLLGKTKDLFFIDDVECIKDNKEIKNNKLVGYTIRYNIDYKEYLIIPKEKNIEVIEYDVVMCIQAPCDPIERDSFKVDYKKEYSVVLERIIKNSKGKDVVIREDDLSINDSKIINEIVGSNGEISYKIIDNLTDYDGVYATRGFYVEESATEEVKVTIAMGERNTGGYNITIDRIKMNGRKATIYVVEESPKKNDVVTMAFTYPIAKVTFSEMPTEIEVINKETNYSFERIN